MYVHIKVLKRKFKYNSDIMKYFCLFSLFETQENYNMLSTYECNIFPIY